MKMEDYITIPYREGGRDHGGADCWGLVGLVYQNETGKQLPFFPNAPSLSTAEKRFRILAKPEDLCIVHMRSFEPIPHVGIYYRGGILHMTRRGALCESYLRVRHLILGLYKPLDYEIDKKAIMES